MKFKIVRSDFFEALTTAQSIVEKKNVIPILSNILIEARAKESIINIIATDLEVAVHLSVGATVERHGSITVSAKSLYDIIRESQSQEIAFEVADNDRIHIQSMHSDYKIMGLPANDYPSLPTIEGKMTRVKTEDLAQMFDKICFAMSSDETRYHLNGALFEHVEGSTTIVATDGHRLSLVKRPIDFSMIKQNKVIIPRKGVNELKRLLSQKAVDICVSERHFFIQTEKQTLYIRLIDGNYPDYNRVVPTANNLKINVPKEELLGAIKRVSLLSDDNSKGVMFYFCNKALTVSSSNPALGEAKEDIALDYKGPTLNIGFNARYFLDVLSVISDKEVILHFKDEVSPCLITCESEAGFKSVIMPMRL